MSVFLNAVSNYCNTQNYATEVFSDRIKAKIRLNDATGTLIFYARDEKLGVCSVGLNTIPIGKEAHAKIDEVTSVANQQFGGGALSFLPEKELIASVSIFDVPTNGVIDDDQIERLVSDTIAKLAFLIQKVKPLLRGSAEPVEQIEGDDGDDDDGMFEVLIDRKPAA